MNKSSIVETDCEESNVPSSHEEVIMFGQKVINLSSKKLNDAEKSLLCKGLKFCPTQKIPDAGEIKKDLNVFHDKLRTKEFFKKNQNLSERKSDPNSKEKQNVLDKISPYGNVTSFLKLRQKSNWRPPTGSPNLETFANTNEMSLSKAHFPINKRQNISDLERTALKDLAKNREITIKPADKGGAIVIMDTTDYITEANRQLNDTGTYTKLDKNPTDEFNQAVEIQLTNMVQNGDITEKIKKILLLNKPRTPQIYFLPKIHKNKIPPPGRPIVSANSCPTEKISAFVDHFLNPLVKERKSYVKDTTDFINKIEDLAITKDSIIGTLDVTSLYTNIPNSEGIQCIREILNRERNKLEKPSNESLIDLLDMVLTKNNFQFNKQNYLQIGGTAMGTRVAPTYANLFMANLEEKLVSSYKLQPKIWLRYIDDIFFIWEHGKDELEKWLDYLNKSHKTIKFTAEQSSVEINFLDTKVKVNQNEQKLYTDLYVKPTDTNSYLKYNSAHPPKCKDSLPYSQFLRIKRICKKNEDYEKHTNLKVKEFIEKGYPMKKLLETKEKVDELDRSKLLEPKSNSKKTDLETVFLTTTYREGYQYVPKIIKSNWDILARSCTTKETHRSTLRIGYKKPKDLRSYLIRAKTEYDPIRKNSGEGISAGHNNKCNKKNCIYCTILDTGGEIYNDKRRMSSKHNITCNSSNVIYCIECTRCKSKYVGQTKRKIKDRLREHIYGIKNQKETDVSYHFNTHGHKGKNDMKVYILDFIHAHPESERAKTLRNTIEKNWITRMGSLAPKGMNIMDGRYG